MGKRPTFPYHVPKCNRRLIQMCWSQIPEDRPSFDEIVNMINNPEFLAQTSVSVKEFQKYVNFINGFSNEYDDKDEQLYKQYMKKFKFEPSFVEQEICMRQRYDDFHDKSVLIDLSLFTKLEKIGEGSYGKVYKIKNAKDIYFAAKVSKNEINLKEFLKNSNELLYMMGFHHPSIIKFVGFSHRDFKQRKKPVIITEYAQKGSLESILQQEKSQHSISSTNKLICIYGIASAMSYLHSQNILHLDLKTGNVLVDSSFHPKISDFGLSLQLPRSGKKIKIEIRGIQIIQKQQMFMLLD